MAQGAGEDDLTFPRVSLPGCFGVACGDIMVRGFSRRDVLFLSFLPAATPLGWASANCAATTMRDRSPSCCLGNAADELARAGPERHSTSLTFPYAFLIGPVGAALGAAPLDLQ